MKKGIITLAVVIIAFMEGAALGFDPSDTILLNHDGFSCKDYCEVNIRQYCQGLKDFPYNSIDECAAKKQTLMNCVSLCRSRINDLLGGVMGQREIIDSPLVQPKPSWWQRFKKSPRSTAIAAPMGIGTSPSAVGAAKAKAAGVVGAPVVGTDAKIFTPPGTATPLTCTVTTLASHIDSYDLAFDPSGFLYFVDAADHQTIKQFDLSQNKVVNVWFGSDEDRFVLTEVGSFVFNAQGNLYFSSPGAGYQRTKIQKLDGTSGNISLMNELAMPFGVLVGPYIAVDSAGWVVVMGDRAGTSSLDIDEVDTHGHEFSLARGYDANIGFIPSGTPAAGPNNEIYFVGRKGGSSSLRKLDVKAHFPSDGETEPEVKDESIFTLPAGVEWAHVALDKIGNAYVSSWTPGPSTLDPGYQSIAGGQIFKIDLTGRNGPAYAGSGTCHPFEPVQDHVSAQEANLCAIMSMAVDPRNGDVYFVEGIRRSILRRLSCSDHATQMAP